MPALAFHFEMALREDAPGSAFLGEVAALNAAMDSSFLAWSSAAASSVAMVSERAMYSACGVSRTKGSIFFLFFGMT